MALDKKKKKKVSSDGLSTKEKMLARKKQLESKGNGNGLVFPKEDMLSVVRYMQMKRELNSITKVKIREF